MSRRLARWSSSLMSSGSWRAHRDGRAGFGRRAGNLSRIAGMTRTRSGAPGLSVCCSPRSGWNRSSTRRTAGTRPMRSFGSGAARPVGTGSVARPSRTPRRRCPTGRSTCPTPTPAG